MVREPVHETWVQVIQCELRRSSKNSPYARHHGAWWVFNFTLSLNLALKQETCQLHALTALTTEERATNIHGIGYWVYLRSSVDCLVKSVPLQARGAQSVPES